MSESVTQCEIREEVVDEMVKVIMQFPAVVCVVEMGVAAATAALVEESGDDNSITAAEFSVGLGLLAKAWEKYRETCPEGAMRIHAAACQLMTEAAAHAQLTEKTKWEVN